MTNDQVAANTALVPEPMLISFLLHNNDIVSNEVCVASYLGENPNTHMVMLKQPALFHINTQSQFVGIKSLMPCAVGDMVSMPKSSMIAIGVPTPELVLLYKTFVSKVGPPLRQLNAQCVRNCIAALSDPRPLTIQPGPNGTLEAEVSQNAVNTEDTKTKHTLH